MDNRSKKQRSAVMAKIRSINTKPELILRSALHKLGYRYSLYNEKLPGKPDLTLRKYKSVIYINGCFWHRHSGCKNAKTPKTNKKYWLTKFNQNKERDKINYTECNKLGWKTIIVWECEIENNLSETLIKIEKQLRKNLNA